MELWMFSKKEHSIDSNIELPKDRQFTHLSQPTIIIPKLSTVQGE